MNDKFSGPHWHLYKRENYWELANFFSEKSIYIIQIKLLFPLNFLKQPLCKTLDFNRVLIKLFQFVKVSFGT